MEKLAYTLAEAVEMTGLSRSTLYRLAGANRIITIKVGTRRLVTRQALERFLNELSREARERAGDA